VPEIREFDFGKDEIKITLGEDLGFITLDRNEGVLTFETRLRKLDIRLVEGAKFFLGEAAGYSEHVYVRLDMPPGYGPVRSLGRVRKNSQDGKLFVDVANLCVPQSQPVFRSEADVPVRRRKIMRLVLSVLLLAIAIGVFYYWFSFRNAVRRRANFTAEAMAAYNRYHENLTFAPPFYDTTGPRSGNFVSMLANTTIEPPYEITARTFVKTTLRPGRTLDKSDFIRVLEEEDVDLREIVSNLLQKYIAEGKFREARDCALALIVFGQDSLLVYSLGARDALLIQSKGIGLLQQCMEKTADEKLVEETVSYLEKLAKFQPPPAAIIYGMRLEAEMKFAEFAEPLGFISRPTGDKANPHNYNLMDFVREWESYRKTMSEIEAVFRKPVSENSKEIGEVREEFRQLPELFRNNTPDPFKLVESYEKTTELFGTFSSAVKHPSGK